MPETFLKPLCQRSDVSRVRGKYDIFDLLTLSECERVHLVPRTVASEAPLGCDIEGGFGVYLTSHLAWARNAIPDVKRRGPQVLTKAP